MAYFVLLVLRPLDLVPLTDFTYKIQISPGVPQPRNLNSQLCTSTHVRNANISSSVRSTQFSQKPFY